MVVVMERAVVLMSGGMDSCVVASRAARSYELWALHAKYGQRTEERELAAFIDLCEYFDIPFSRRLICNLPFYRKIGSSSIIDPSMEIPEGDEESRLTPPTYVPFRNAILLSIAVAWAESIGASKVFIGAVEEDAAGYPDCRKGFIDSFNAMVGWGTREETKVEVIAPLIAKDKAWVVREGMRLGAPFHITWACYSSSGPEPCMKCLSCLKRKRAFDKAGFPDPLLSSKE